MEGRICGGDLRSQIDCASPVVESRFTGGAYIWRGDLTEVLLRYRFGGLIFGGGLYMERLTLGILR